MAVAGAVVPLAIVAASPATASAAPVRTAVTSSYTDTTFLQDDLGLPTSDTNPVIESVTYDRFQWLLQQSGNFAFLVGDPAEDANFKARAQDVEAAAKAAGVKKVYWFDPNLSGGNGTATGTTVGTSTHEPNLDIRNPAGILSLSPASETTYGYAWLNVVGQYLGNGVTATPASQGTENATVTAVTGTATVNNYTGYSTSIANGVTNSSANAPWDYTADTTYPAGLPANTSDSYFFIYNNANTVSVAGTPEPEKIASWIDLDGESSSAQTQTDVTSAITAVGASSLTEIDQFAWWESEVNSKEVTQASSTADGGNVPVLSSADNDPANGGWKVDQITYPELVDLLKTNTAANAVILFGGTWCPNTRPVLPFVNKYAQQNNVEVFNFDTVLDGGIVGGSTTGAGNPLQSRNYVGSASSTDPTNSNPTYLYGDVVSSYLDNMETEYDPTLGTGFVSYYPGGVTTSALKDVRKLQVPFLIGYQKASSSASTLGDGGGTGGVTRQWIQQDTDVNGLPYFKEYMSDWWFTNPQANELGVSSATLPQGASIWSTINSELASVNWQTDPTTLDPNTGTDADDAQYLASGDKANVTFTPPSTVSAVFSASGAVAVDPASLSAALSALGASAPVNYTGAKAALVTAETASPQNPTLIGNLTTVVGAWGVAQTRKTKVTQAWGNASTPGSVVGGAAAVHALDLFFGGLPGGAVSTQTVTANSVTYGTAPTITVAIANQYGRIPSSNVAVVVQKGGSTVATASSAVSQGAASVTLPILSPGSYTYTVSYPGDSQILPFTNTGSLTVSPAGANVVGISTVVDQEPSAKVEGSYKVTLSTPSGLATASGAVTVHLANGATHLDIAGTLTNGVVTVALPELAAGVWNVGVSWAGDANYPAAEWAGASIDVPRVAPDKVKGSVSKAPTVKAAGKYKVTISTPSGFSNATGKVTLKVKKGSTTRTVTGKLSKGAVLVNVPKLTSGTWKVAISWAGDSDYLAASATGPSIKVKAAAVKKKAGKNKKK
jgi:Bacterial Ig-like domain (group 3)